MEGNGAAMTDAKGLSEVQRYFCETWGMSENIYGDYVKHDDYTALAERWDESTVSIRALNHVIKFKSGQIDQLTADLQAARAEVETYKQGCVDLRERVTTWVDRATRLRAALAEFMKLRDVNSTVPRHYFEQAQAALTETKP
jgi:chromosome segregation ATPase